MGAILPRLTTMANTTFPTVATINAYCWAYDAQSACNLSGIVFKFNSLIKDMDETDVPFKDVCRLFSEQVTFLSNTWEARETDPSRFGEIKEVAAEFATVMQTICDERNSGTDERNKDPRAQEMARKLAAIVGTNSDDWTPAYHRAGEIYPERENLIQRAKELHAE